MNKYCFCIYFKESREDQDFRRDFNLISDKLYVECSDHFFGIENGKFFITFLRSSSSLKEAISESLNEIECINPKVTEIVIDYHMEHWDEYL